MRAAACRRARLLLIPTNAVPARRYAHVPPPSWSLESLAATPSTTTTSSPALSHAELARVARLSHLDLPDSPVELDALRAGLQRMLDMTSRVQAAAATANASSSSPTYPALTDGQRLSAADARLAELRPDVVTEGGIGQALVAAAGRSAGRYFTVPNMRGAEEAEPGGDPTSAPTAPTAPGGGTGKKKRR